MSLVTAILSITYLLRSRTNTVRTEHHTFHDSHNVRVTTIIQICNIEILVGLSSMWQRRHMYTLDYTCIRTLLCTLVPWARTNNCVRRCTRSLFEWALDWMSVFCSWLLALRTNITRELIDGGGRLNKDTCVTILIIDSRFNWSCAYYYWLFCCIGITITIVPNLIIVRSMSYGRSWLHTSSLTRTTWMMTWSPHPRSTAKLGFVLAGVKVRQNLYFRPTATRKPSYISSTNIQGDSVISSHALVLALTSLVTLFTTPSSSRPHSKALEFTMIVSLT